METENLKKNWKIYSLFLGIIVILCFVIYIVSNDERQYKTDADKFQKLYHTERSSNSALSMRVDSMQKAIKELYAYQPLTSEMIQRDKIRSTMKYQPGDFARMKIDSSKVLIVDIVAGGDKYNYTLKYKIQKGHNIHEEISPQLLY